MSISVQNLVKRFGERTVIDHVSFEIADGELVSLLGQSGCGKTTTLRCIAGLEQPESGRIEIDGQVVFDSDTGIMVEPYRRSIGMVFQSYAIWPHLTVFENVAFPLRIRHEKREAVERRVTRALEMVGLAALHDRPSQQLSGGQQQRIAVARAIVHAPAVLLFDEPLSNLDARLRDRTRAEIRRLQRELNVATVYVTHDQAEALSLSDRILVMHAGCIRQAGTPQEIYARPNDAFVADVVGATNFFDIVVTALRPGGVAGRGPGDVPIHAVGTAAIGESAGVMVRPDRFALAAEDTAGEAPNRLHGVVQQRLFLGGQFEYAVQVGATLLRAVSPVEVAETARVCLSFAPEDCIVLAGDAVGARD